ncbi:MAG: SDR family NAD(P)-dependent oxidoreductase, partial [Bacteroidota bacterium]|nr:SDR family NAD(P)-dependent oxidoreductase [Bacteroidota bacterium]
MDFKLKGKKAFISASTSGIGLEAARILLNEGMTVYINGRSEKTVKKAVEYLKNEIRGSEVKGIVADFLKQGQVNNLLSSLKDVDVLINNVGIYSSTSFFNTP